MFRLCLVRMLLVSVLATCWELDWQCVAQDRAAEKVDIYDKDPQHLWNRLHAALLVRVGPDQNRYGIDRLEPLLWGDSEYLLQGKLADEAAAVLDEFVRTRGETLIQDPLKRAVLQRDLWLVANWAADHGGDGADKLLDRLVPVIQRVALSREQITQLPDNYVLATASGKFPTQFDPEKSHQGFLPRELFQEKGPWVCIGRSQGPTAPQHLQNGNAFNNSTFLIFLNLPGGRAATLEFMEQLAAFDKPLYVPNPDEKTHGEFQNLPNPALPQWPKRTAVALVRRALLIDTKGKVVASPLTESVQLRVMRVDTPPLTVEILKDMERGLSEEIVNGRTEPAALTRASGAQAFAEFQLSKRDLLAGRNGGLRDMSNVRDFKTGFSSHMWDEFTLARTPFPERAQPFVNQRASCIGCHRYPGVYSFNSFHSMFPFALQRKISTGDDEGFVAKPNRMVVKSVPDVEQAAVSYKTTRRLSGGRSSSWPLQDGS